LAEKETVNMIKQELQNAIGGEEDAADDV